MKNEPTSHVTIAKPGSEEARRLGCACPVVDNRNGEGRPGTSGRMFYVSTDCTLHYKP